MKARVTIWHENVHDKVSPKVQELYPGGMHKFLAGRLAAPDLDIRTATLDDPECGLTKEALAATDVLTWWGHAAHDKVPDEIVNRIQERVWEGMGLVCLHSAHMSKIFKALNGTSGKLHWREAGERERIWTLDPSHPIAQGLPEHFELPYEEMYGEPFMIAGDAHIVFMSWFEGGELFRSGFTLQRGNGKVFYFRPGHETFPSYHDANVLKVIGNAIRWARPTIDMPYPKTHVPGSLEKISKKDFELVRAGIVKD